jgi:hypothetical protein
MENANISVEPVSAEKFLLPSQASRRRRLYFLLALGVLAGAICAFCRHVGWSGDNFHAVTPGKCYRSAQLGPESLAAYLREYGINSVVSVRGASSHEDWVAPEEKVCREQHCLFYAFDLHLGAWTAPKELSGLVTRLEEGPYPLLLHCRSGSDRTGLASVLYLMVVERKSLDEALKQLSWHFGHFNAGKAAVVDELFELYRNTGQGMDIKAWLAEVYPRLYAQHYPSKAGEIHK